MISLLLVISGWFAHARQESKSLLWKVEGHNIQTSYLFGTIHLLPQDDFAIKEKVSNAFNASEQIVLELDMDDPTLQMKMMQHAPMKEGITLDQVFSEEEYTAVSNALKEQTGMGLENMNTMKPIVITSMLIGKLIEGTPASYEMTFVQMARERELEILGLETVADQMAVFDRIPYQEQAKDVMEMINHEEEMRKEFSEMIIAYNNEDIDQLYDIIDEYTDTETEMEELVVKRNKSWIPLIGELAQEKTTFFGVGAAHLGGDQGVINLLKEAGYTVTPIN